MIRALVFDLDDTLYCERDFVISGYCAVARWLAARCGGAWEDACELMTRTLAVAGRREVFPAALRLFPDSGLEIGDLVAIYRSHLPEIGLFSGYEELLGDLRKSYRLGLITDGNPSVQRAKCSVLRLENFFDQMIFTWDYGQENEKPYPFPFRLMLDRLGVSASEAVFIGDSIEKDCRGARGVGMKSIRVRNQGTNQAAEHEADADIVIDSLIQLPFILSILRGEHEAA